MIEASEREYSVGEVAEILKEEIYNLRYWQKELGLPDRRNEMNQRIYTQDDINRFKFIKELRSLKAIRKVLRKTGIIINEETAATNDVAVVGVNNYTAAVDKLKADLVGEIKKTMDDKNDELKQEIDDLKEKIDYLEQERNSKIDQLIAEWRKKNQRKGFFSSIFK